LRAALELYLKVPAEAPTAAAAQQRAGELEPKVIEAELDRAEQGSKSIEGWREAHERLIWVLDRKPDLVKARDLIYAIEKKMRGERIRFEPFVPPEARAAAQEQKRSPEEEAEAINRFVGDEQLAKVVAAYREGAADKAAKRAAAAVKSAKGAAKKKKAKKYAAAIKKLAAKYDRVRTALGNDPAEAWAHLIEFEQMEQEILPEGMKSYLRTELEHSIADAFADQGGAMFEQQKFEEAFQKWDAGYKLNPANPKVVAGLKKLEAKAEKLVEEAEIAAQRGQPGICDRWRRITRMTTAAAEPHKKAKQRVKESCGT
jgi:hypothetical protein